MTDLVNEVTGGSLTAGDELDEVAPPVDQHLVPVAPEPRGRVSAELPAFLTDPAVAREMAVRAAREAKLRAVAGVVSAPHATGVASLWVIRGAVRAVVEAYRWLYDVEMHPSKGALRADDPKVALEMEKRRAARRKSRLVVTGVAVVVALVAVLVLPGWALLAAGVTAAVGMGWLGRPEGEHLLSPGVVKHEQPRLTSQNIVRALGALGMPRLTQALEKGDTSRLWRSSITAVKGGYKVWIQLPNGTVADQLLEHEQRLAAALGRPEDCVIVVPKPHVTPGDLDLYVFDRPQLTSDIGPGPLATAKKASWWEPVVIGKTRLGEPHREPLRGGAWFVGGRPASGKSSLCRIAAAQSALDPRSKLRIVNLKGSPDYVALRPVCDRYIAGSPETDPTVLDRTVDLLRDVLAECGRRNDFLTELVERGAADSADVTPELAERYEQLQPMTVILDEVHRLFDPADFGGGKEGKEAADGAAELLGKVIKAVRSAGITLICATQLAGTEAVPPVVTRAARLRGCLVVSDHISYQQIFGNGTGEGFKSSGVAKFRPGTVLLRTEDGAPVKVGCHNITPAVLAQIGKRALEARERLHLLTGEAAGEVVEVAEREDPALLLRDILANIEAAEPNRSGADKGVAWLHSLEELLDHDRAPGWLVPELRDRRVQTERVNRKGAQFDGGQLTAAAVRATQIRRALQALGGGADEA